MLKAEIGNGPMPALTTTSPTAKGATRRWNSVDDFVQRGRRRAHLRGIHYRTSTEVGAAMGQQIGELAAKRMEFAD